MENLLIRTLTMDEVKSIAVEWAAAEGWNPGLNDYKAFYKTDPNGFLGGFINNEPVACISVVSYPACFSFLGFYIVKPEFRGLGYGLKIWNKGMEYLAGHNVGLDGVVAQQANYAKSGFKLAYNNIRYEGKAVKTDSLQKDIFPFETKGLEEIILYDSRLFPADRKVFLKEWTSLQDAQTFVHFENEKVTGYITIRKCRTGFKIGPLFADNSEIAEKLFSAANRFAGEGSLIYLDTPQVNVNAVNLAEKSGMKKVFETARMYTGPFPQIDLNKVFGVTTFELG